MSGYHYFVQFLFAENSNIKTLRYSDNFRNDFQRNKKGKE